MIHDNPHLNNLASNQGWFFLNGGTSQETCGELSAAILNSVQSTRGLADKPIFRLYINSYGGSVAGVYLLGSTIQRVKREYGVSFDTYIIGVAQSGGFILSQYGDIRYASSNSILMMHDIQKGVSRGDRDNIRRELFEADMIAKQLARVCASRNTAEWTDPVYWETKVFKDGDHYWSAEDALRLGLVDVIEDDIPTR